MVSDDLKIVLFDGVCNLCIGTVRFIIKHDSKARIKFAQLQSQKGKELLKHFNLRVDQTDFIIYIREGNCYIKSTAILLVLRDLGGAWKLGYSLMIVPKFIRDFFYDMIAKRRFRIFGRQGICMVPTPDIKTRFLE